MKFEKEAKSLFGKMRESTKEENKAIGKYIDSISVPTGRNLFKLIDEDKGENKEI